MLTVRGLGTGGNMSHVGKEDTVSKLSRIREGVEEKQPTLEALTKVGNP